MDCNPHHLQLHPLAHQAGPSQAAVPLIIDTDASFDVDDVVAVCMAHALMDNGEVSRQNSSNTYNYFHLFQDFIDLTKGRKMNSI